MLAHIEGKNQFEFEAADLKAYALISTPAFSPGGSLWSCEPVSAPSSQIGHDNALCF